MIRINLTRGLSVALFETTDWIYTANKTAFLCEIEMSKRVN